jgi:hypothetical protein
VATLRGLCFPPYTVRNRRFRGGPDGIGQRPGDRSSMRLVLSGVALTRPTLRAHLRGRKPAPLCASQQVQQEGRLGSSLSCPTGGRSCCRARPGGRTCGRRRAP